MWNRDCYIDWNSKYFGYLRSVNECDYTFYLVRLGLCDIRYFEINCDGHCAVGIGVRYDFEKKRIELSRPIFDEILYWTKNFSHNRQCDVMLSLAYPVYAWFYGKSIFGWSIEIEDLWGWSPYRNSIHRVVMQYFASHSQIDRAKTRAKFILDTYEACKRVCEFERESEWWYEAVLDNQLNFLFQIADSLYYHDITWGIRIKSAPGAVKCIKKNVRIWFNKRVLAQKTISSRWKECITNPKYQMCRKRLLQELTQMNSVLMIN